MATTTFTYGDDIRIEAGERATLNGVRGMFWIERRKYADGSGWMRWGKIHMPERATRRAIVERLGLIWRPELVKA